MKLFLGLLCILVFGSCSEEKRSNETIFVEQNTSDTTLTRFTFSLPFDADFGLSAGSYILVYNFSKEVDTALNYSGPYIIGKDTIIYTQIVRDKGVNICGHIFEASKLMLFANDRFQELDLDYFDPMFSSYLVVENTIYYWGFDHYQLKLCSYNLKTKRLRVISTNDETLGTDFFGAYFVPNFVNNKLIFKNSEKTYETDLNFKFIKTINHVNDNEKNYNSDTLYY